MIKYKELIMGNNTKLTISGGAKCSGRDILV